MRIPTYSHRLHRADSFHQANQPAFLLPQSPTKRGRLAEEPSHPPSSPQQKHISGHRSRAANCCASKSTCSLTVHEERGLLTDTSTVPEDSRRASRYCPRRYISLENRGRFIALNGSAHLGIRSGRHSISDIDPDLIATIRHPTRCKSAVGTTNISAPRLLHIGSSRSIFCRRF